MCRFCSSTRAVRLCVSKSKIFSLIISLGMFASGCNYNKLKTNLRLAINRLKLLGKKKTELTQKARKDIADYISCKLTVELMNFSVLTEKTPEQTPRLSYPGSGRILADLPGWRANQIFFAFFDHLAKRSIFLKQIYPKNSKIFEKNAQKYDILPKFRRF